MYSTLPPSRGKDQLKSLLHDAFSLLAYTDPSTSPVGYLLDPSQREPVCVAVNSAILGRAIVFNLILTSIDPLSLIGLKMHRVQEPPWSTVSRVCSRTGCAVSETHVEKRTWCSCVYRRAGHNAVVVILTSSFIVSVCFSVTCIVLHHKYDYYVTHTI